MALPGVKSRPLFCLFSPFLFTITILQIEKSLDGVLGIRTYDHRMVGADETTEQWQPPGVKVVYNIGRSS